MIRRTVLRATIFLALAAPASSKEIRLTLREGTNFSTALSPVDASFVLNLQGTLWRLPAAGGSATAMTDGLGDDRLPDVSRDGSRVVFQSFRSGTWDIWTLSLGPTGQGSGSEAAAITSGPADDREPAISPDGARVAFSSDRSGNYDLFVLDLATAELKQVTSDAANDFMPAWSSKGDEIVFVSDRGGKRGLYRMKSSGAGEAVVVAEGVVSSPSVSPDGKLVAFRRIEGESSRLAVVPLTGGEPRLLETPEDVFPFRPQWSGTSEESSIPPPALCGARVSLPALPP